MAKLTSTSAALIALLLTGFAGTASFAQETTAPAAEGASDATVAADAATANDLSLGSTEGEAAADGIGSTYTAATFDSWEQRCVKTESGVDPCQLYQLLKDKDGNSVAEISLFNLPAGSEGPAVAGATIIVPLETLLTSGVVLKVDAGKSKTYPFSFCANLGCVARVGFLQEEIDNMKKGAKATLTIVPFVAQDQKVDLDVSLKGFTAGMDAVKAANDKADAAEAAAGGN